MSSTFLLLQLLESISRRDWMDFRKIVERTIEGHRKAGKVFMADKLQHALDVALSPDGIENCIIDISGDRQ